MNKKIKETNYEEKIEDLINILKNSDLSIRWKSILEDKIFMDYFETRESLKKEIALIKNEKMNKKKYFSICGEELEEKINGELEKIFNIADNNSINLVLENVIMLKMIEDFDKLENLDIKQLFLVKITQRMKNLINK